MKRLIIILLALTLIGCEQSSPQLTARSLDATYAAGTSRAPTTAFAVFPTQSPTPTPENAPTAPTGLPEGVLATPSPTKQPQATPTSSILEVTPCGQSICEVAGSADDPVAILARLCVVEVRRFAEVRDAACQSVVEVVLHRIDAGYLSDGTVRGTVLWNCTAESCLQFPGYVVNGCSGIIASACPWSYPADIAHFISVVSSYLAGGPADNRSCIGYLYYDSRPSVPFGACVIQAINGQREVFHN